MEKILFMFSVAVTSSVQALTIEELYEACNGVKIEMSNENIKSNYPQCWGYFEAVSDILTKGNDSCFPDTEMPMIIGATVVAMMPYNPSQPTPYFNDQQKLEVNKMWKGSAIKLVITSASNALYIQQCKPVRMESW